MRSTPRSSTPRAPHVPVPVAGGNRARVRVACLRPRPGTWRPEGCARRGRQRHDGGAREAAAGGPPTASHLGIIGARRGPAAHGWQWLDELLGGLDATDDCSPTCSRAPFRRSATASRRAPTLRGSTGPRTDAARGSCRSVPEARGAWRSTPGPASAREERGMPGSTSQPQPRSSVRPSSGWPPPFADPTAHCGAATPARRRRPRRTTARADQPRTRAISASVVSPARTLASPSSRSRRMPCSSATPPDLLRGRAGNDQRADLAGDVEDLEQPEASPIAGVATARAANGLEDLRLAAPQADVLAGHGRRLAAAHAHRAARAAER